jgi:hypothetical protein
VVYQRVGSGHLHDVQTLLLVCHAAALRLLQRLISEDELD